MRFRGDKKILILTSIFILAAFVFIAVFLFSKSHIKEIKEAKIQTAPIEKQDKIMTPEEEKEALLEIIRKKEESLPPGEAARRKDAAEKERQELLNYLKNK